MTIALVYGNIVRIDMGKPLIALWGKPDGVTEIVLF